MSQVEQHSHRPGERAASDTEAALLEQVCSAIHSRTPLSIQGGGSKSFLGHSVPGELLDISPHRGIVTYDPTELVITVRAGTRLSTLQAELDAQGQMLAFEPPHFSDRATVGGMLASGLSGPRRPWTGSARDFVLGTRVITGQGKLLRFGGEVMKNVAGYDLSRLLVGSYGTLGIITEASMKVLPKPRASAHLSLDMDPGAALQKLSEWGQKPFPITAACHDGNALHLRLEGGTGSVKDATEMLGGDELDPAFWTQLRELTLPFFSDPRPLWRLSLPNHSPLLNTEGDELIDWGGAQRWLKTDMSEHAVQQLALSLGGHATCYTPGHSEYPFQPLPPLLMKHHQQLKQKLDPSAIFNLGRLYALL